MNSLRKIILAGFIAALSVAVMDAAVFAEDVRVAIIDSGATGYVDDAKTFTSIAATHDPLNHGTQVAKLIRQGDPFAKIIMLQVCEREEGGFKPSRQAILDAIAWCVRSNIRLVNMSLVVKYDSEIEKAIEEASTSHGVIFVAAAGNRTIASRFAAGDDGYIRRMSKAAKPAFPASSPYVISVGAFDDEGNIASYSDKTCDVYANGKIPGQEGTSFSSARITVRVSRILAEKPYATDRIILSSLTR